jgi:predicted small lipoprotein YifL
MPHPVGCIALIAFLSLTGCGKHGPGSNDLSTPKAAVQSYADAISRGDVEAAKATVTGGDAQMIDTLASIMMSHKRLEDAAVAKFGEEGKSLVGNRSSAEDVNKWVADAEVKQEGDTATVAPKDHSNPGLDLKKVGSEWKIDLSATPGIKELPKMLPMLQKMNAAGDELASEISAGKYKTLAEAKAAQQQKMMAAMMGAAGESFAPNLKMPKTPDQGK